MISNSQDIIQGVRRESEMLLDAMLDSVHAYVYLWDVASGLLDEVLGDG